MQQQEKQGRQDESTGQPMVQLSWSDNTAAVTIIGSAEDNLDTVANAATAQWNFLTRDWISTQYTNVNVVRPTDD